MKTKNYVVKKSNILNELQLGDMTLFEYKLFCIVLSKLNTEEGYGTISIPLEEYAEIMDIKRVRHSEIKKQCSEIVKKTCVLDFPDGRGYATYAFIHMCKVYRRESDDKWTITLKINPELIPLVAEGQKWFISYKLYNTIYLNSYQHIRIYELLKQYESKGERILTLEELRNYLSIGKDQYKEWYEFRRWVLESAQVSIKKSTDIEFEFEPIRECRKITSVKFIIKKKENYVDLFEERTNANSSNNEGQWTYFSVEMRRDFFEGAISMSDDLTDAEKDYIISVAWKSEFAQSLDCPRTSFEFKEQLYDYISMQDAYTRAKCPENYMAYLISAIKENYAKV